MADYLYSVYPGTVTRTFMSSFGINIESITPGSAGAGKRPDWYWGPPDKELTRRPRCAEYVQMLDNSQKKHGGYYFQWGWKFMPIPALDAFCNQVGLGASFSAAAESAACTVTTLVTGYWGGVGAYSFNLPFGNYKTYQVTVLQPIPDEHYTPVYGGVENIVFRFVGGVETTT